MPSPWNVYKACVELRAMFQEIRRPKTADPTEFYLPITELRRVDALLRADDAQGVAKVGTLPDYLLSISELIERDFERFGTKELGRNRKIGLDRLEVMARRAVARGFIYDDFRIMNPNKRPQLWARNKPNK
jgi:hypothetical protein